MADTLSGLARGIGAAIRRSPADPVELADLATRLEAYAAAEPALVPDTRVNLLTQLARAVDPACPRDAATALATLGVEA